MNNDISDWLKSQLKDEFNSGAIYYVARQKLIDKGYSKIDIYAAVDGIRQSAIPEDSSMIVWLSRYDEDVNAASNRAFGNSVLSGVPVVGPVFGIRSIKQSLDVASNTSGRSKKSVTIIWVSVMIAAAVIAYELPALLSPFDSLLPSGLVIPVFLFVQYGVPVILIVVTWRYLFRKR